jgi:hypothetical protein
MGPEAVNAARMFHNGDTAPLFFETLTYSGSMTHNNAGGGTTDSAASSTAMATGVKVNNRVISVRRPGDGSELQTVLEILSADGKRTGLVTSDVDITDATPAGFGAHADKRSYDPEIADDYLTQTRPNVLFGRSQDDLLLNAAGAGYEVVTTGAGFAALDTGAQTHYAGLFDSIEQPSLADMTATALDILDNDLARVMDSVLELNDAVATAHSWASTAGVLGDTLIIVTADHETGGLDVTANNGAGVPPDHTWSTTGHTKTPVAVYATGPAADASRVSGVIDNTDIHYILTSTQRAPVEGITKNFQQGLSGYAGTVDTFVQQSDPTVDNSIAEELNVDDDDPGGTDQHAQVLLRFDDIFGPEPGRVPLDKDILEALLIVDIDNSGDSMELHRMLEIWSDSDTWDSLAGGVSADGAQAAVSPDATSGPNSSSSVWAIDVTASLQAWQLDPSTNHGWAFLPTDDNGVDFFSAEGLTPPKLAVRYTPEPASIAILALGAAGLLRRFGRK